MTEFQVPNFCSENLDLNPNEGYLRLSKRLQIVWIIMGILGIVFLIFEKYIGRFSFAITILLVLGLIIVPGLFILVFKFARLPSLCDNMDYTNIQKKNFIFTTSDGVQLSAFEYRLMGQLDEGIEKKFPAVIGVHGWFANHRRMDRFCLPLVRKARFIYYTFDARGHGTSKGDKSDFKQLEDVKEFIDFIVKIPYIDKKKITMIGSSMGAAKAAIAGYPHPDIKAIVLISGNYDLAFTESKLTLFYRILLKLSGMKIPKDKSILLQYNALNIFRPEGIRLREQTTTTSNNDRVFMMYAIDDPLVHPDNSRQAVEKLQLSSKNIRAFPHGRHYNEGNEFDLAIEIFHFFSTHI